MNPSRTAIAHLSRRFRFSASHRLHIEALSAEQNQAIFGKCNNPYGHGHNYVVQVTLAGPVDAATGMVVNLADLDTFAQRELLACFDGSNLNAHPGFRERVPSTENLCLEFWRIFAAFARQHAPLQLKRIRVEETNNNAFDYFGVNDSVPAFDLTERPTTPA